MSLPVSAEQSFNDGLKSLGKGLKKDVISIIQVNIGNLCNQSCIHCHVSASPDSADIMAWGTMEEIIAVLKGRAGLSLDITGGAPELHPNIEDFISKCSFYVNAISFRSNLTALLLKEPMIKTLKDYKVELICSLPDTFREKTNCQRGKGVFEKSIQTLKVLNDIGYGYEIPLHLVHNPSEFMLPELQCLAEKRYRSYLSKEYGIFFHKLFILNNMPIGRFMKVLESHNNYKQYMNTLSSNFNPATLDGLMCRYILNIGWDGKIYDCDFNNALNMPLQGSLKELNIDTLTGNDILVGEHCYGCTALKGSGCFGNIVR
ncbi:MAG: arsenosugar biosynthesis radical SAM protein ArsS [Thermodesulfovibrionales bacterium]|nr:arsenosugar biosynthesis radical SAM protein ArsS [Thermodesulfovibrionales bacterium]